MELRQVVLPSAGPNWQPGVGFREQPGVVVHVQHYAKLHGAGKLLLGGPFIDEYAGGMMIAAGNVSREELDAFAASDPAVAAGLLTYEVRTWYLAVAKQTKNQRDSRLNGLTNNRRNQV